MADIHDTLGGNVPPPPPFHPSRGPAIHVLGKGAADVHGLALLQAQLSDTQASLAGHVDKLRNLEGLAMEHEAIRSELDILRNQLESSRRVDSEPSARMMQSERLQANGYHGGERAEDDGVDDDAASIRSVDTVRASAPSPPADARTASDLREQNAELVVRLDALTDELLQASAMNHSLFERHTAQADVVRALLTRVDQLETEAAAREKRWEAWRLQFQATYQQDQEVWRQERAQLRDLVDRWQAQGVSSNTAQSVGDARSPSSLTESSSFSDGGPSTDAPSARDSSSDHGRSRRSRSRSNRRRRSQARKREGEDVVSSYSQSGSAGDSRVSSDSDATVASAGEQGYDDDPDKTARFGIGPMPARSSDDGKRATAADLREGNRTMVRSPCHFDVAHAEKPTSRAPR
jgi:hypothetical protein